jgi:hypothetical protein
MPKLANMLLAVALAAMVPSAYADCGHAGNTDYCGPELIQLLYVSANGAVYVQPSTSLVTPPAGFLCKPVAGAYLMLSPAAANFKQIYATLLSARLSGASVTLILDPSQAQCTITYVTL